jgi:GNAT superfamily N-acetyltransferase
VKAVLRAARASDLPAIGDVQLASAREAFAHIGPVDRMEPPDWAPWLELAETALVAEVDEVVGFVFVGGCEVQLFYTHPRVWGQGVGRELLASAEEALAGCEEAFLFTEERNERPLRIYAAAGWLPDGTFRERDWLGVPIRELRLVKRLPGRTPRRPRAA